MKTNPVQTGQVVQRNRCAGSPIQRWIQQNVRVAGLAMLVIVGSLMGARVEAQTVTIAPNTTKYWAGIGASTTASVGSNTVTFANADTTTNVLSLSGAPAGLTTLFTTNSLTNTFGAVGLILNATNIAGGTYPLTITGAGGSYPTYITNVNLFVVPQWTQTNGGSIGNWSDSTKWSGGAVPGPTTGALFEQGLIAPFTNVVDTSFTIPSLVYFADADDAAFTAALNTTINPGATLSVVGTNGFFIGRKVLGGSRPFYTFSGGGALVVSNPVANFSIVDGNANATRYLTVNMTNLNNLTATVSRFGVGDASLSVQGVYNAAQMLNFHLAKTNVITASFTDNYNAVDFNTAIQYERSGVAMNGAQVCAFNMGANNIFNADSIGLGRGNAVNSGSSAYSQFAYPMRFANVFSNSLAPFSTAKFRNVDGVSRMSLLAIAVDSGTLAPPANNAGVADLRGGLIDMLVDQIWIAQNRTNAAGRSSTGGLYFDNGTINANTLIAANMKYTNNAPSITAYVLVGTNGNLLVNSNLVLGLTPTNVTGFEAFAPLVSGQIRIDNGGVLRAKQVTVGQFSTNNQITINNGGLLDITNSIADGNKMLTTLTAAGGGLTLHITGPNTIIYVSNLVGTAASPINVASVSGISSFPATISVIKYGAAITPNNFQGGTGPAGLTVGVANNSGNNSIDITLSTGTPKTLIWKGYVDNTWNSTTKNWLDTVTGVHTNFGALDKVIFDDTAAFTSVSVTEDVVPSQTGTGLLVSNLTTSYTFTGSGRILGGSSLVKAGANSLTVDLYSEFGSSVNAGSMTVTASGTIGSATVSSGAAFVNNGTLLGGLTCGGVAANNGTVTGTMNVQSTGVLTNTATGNGALSMQSGAYFYNSGLLNNIGSPTTPTNSTLVNAGTIYGGALTVNGTLIDTVANSPGVSSGSINVGTLLINGTFIPGGNTIATTKVTDYANNGNQQGNPNGRVQLGIGSITVLQVDVLNNVYTKVLSQNQGFGPSSSARTVTGGTLLITNVSATPFAAGQTFKLFGQYYTDGSLGNAGLNTTNSYPAIVPKVPGPGLVWDLSQLIPGGTIGVIDASARQVQLASSVSFIGSTNIVTELTWPVDYTGIGWVQSQNVALTNGLGTNWVNVGASDYVNDIFLTNTIIGNTATFYRFVFP